MREHLIAPVLEWKAASGGTGELEGYASVFGNVDQGGDVVMPGAFRKTLADWSRSRQPLPLIADHDMSTDGVIGSVREAKEDTTGLWVRAAFSSDQRAQSIRSKMIEGHLSGMSFTYETVKHYMGQLAGKSARFLQELRLFEATVTPFPMNTLATASAKADTTPYGDVTYADPGYQSDGVKRYPLDSEKHCRAAWSYINQADNAGKYTSEQLATIKGRIRSALKKYGVQLESSSLDFTQWADAMRKMLDITFEPAQRAGVNLLVAEYSFDDFSAGPADEQATEDAAAPAGTASKSADYSTAFLIHPPEPRDGALDPLAALDNERTDARLNELEAHINHALGRATP